MTTASQTDTAARAQEADRNIAMLAYGLLIVSVFLAGAPALIAVAIAYGRRRIVGQTVASHHRFQIYIFWVAFALTLLAALFALAAALAILVDLFGAAVHASWENWRIVQFADLHSGQTFFMLVASSIVLVAVTGVWLVVASGYGLARLARRRSIRQAGR